MAEPDPEIRGADVEARDSWSRVEHRLAPSVGAFTEASAWLVGVYALVVARRATRETIAHGRTLHAILAGRSVTGGTHALRLVAEEHRRG